MADTTHTLRIKAELDTSQLQQELDRLNSQKGNASSGSSAGRSTGSLLTKLDNTLSKLNETLRQMQQSMQRASSSPAGSSFAPDMMASSRMPEHSRVQAPAQAKTLQAPAFPQFFWNNLIHARTQLGGFNGQAMTLPEAHRMLNRQFDNMRPNGKFVPGSEGRGGHYEFPNISQKFLRQRQRMIDFVMQFTNEPEAFRLAVQMGLDNPLMDVDGLAKDFRRRGFARTGKIVPAQVLRMTDFQKFPAGLSKAINDMMQWKELQQTTSARPSKLSPEQSFKQRLESYGVGAGVSFLGSALNNVGNMFPETSPTGLYIQSAGNALQGAGAGAMAGAFYGPWGAAVGAVIGGATALASSLTAASTQIDEAMKKNIEFSRSAEVTSRGSINADKMDKITLGSLDAAQQQQFQESELASLRSSRMIWLNRQKELAKADITPENMEKLAEATKEVQQRDQEIAVQENIVEILKRRQNALEEEVEAGERLAQAEREFAETIRRNEERERSMHYAASEANVQAYRAAQRQHREQMHYRDIQTAAFEREMDFQRSQAEISLGMWRGGTAEDYFKKARSQRQGLLVLNAARSHETDPKKLRLFNEEISALQRQFQMSMSLAQALQIQGVRPERVDLQGLTSLASRGGTMGENYSQPDYMATLDKMYDILKSIDDNTREAEKNVWQ